MKRDQSSKPKRRGPGRLLFALAAGIALSHNAHAVLLKEDPFNYTDNERLGAGSSAAQWTAGSSLGHGAWTNRASAALSHPALPASSGGGVRLNVQSTSTRDRGVTFSQNINAENPNVYCSFLINIASPPNGEKLLAYLRSDTSAGTPTVGIWIDSNLRVGVTKSSDDPGRIAYSSGSVLSPNTTHFIVARYHFVNGKTTGDSTDVWIDPHPGTFSLTEPFIPPPTVTTNFGSSRAVISSFMMASKAADNNGSALANIAVDELRIGTTWADVTPGVPGLASKLVFTSPPTDTAVNTTLDPVVVQIQDSYGSPIAQSGVSVTVALLAGNGTLNGTLTQQTDGTGKATFNNLSVNKVNAVAVLSADATNLYEATSDLFAITGGGGTPSAPRITQVLRTPASVILRGDSGDAGQPYDVIASTGISAPRGSWSTVGSSSFDGSGSFSFTNSVAPGDAVRFFSIKPTGTGSGGGSVEGPSGFATVGGITGGEGGPIRIIDNLAAFTAYGQSVDPVIMLVRSNLTLGTQSSDASFYLGPNKTIIGITPGVTISGDLAIYGTNGSTQVATPCTNIIIRNLTITNPNAVGEGDGISVKFGGRNVWVDHCTFVDNPDGMVDVTREGDFVTVSRCKFYYSVTNYASHPDVNLIGGSDSDTSDLGKLHVTFHHNWWGSWCRERMPSVRFGRVHVYNNYFNSPGNNYCTRARLYSEVLVENNYYDNVFNPWEIATSSAGPNGKLSCTGNITNNCTFSTTHYNPNLPSSGVVLIVPGTDTVFTPPYSYTLDPAADIANNVMNNAGADAGPFAP